jgi:hypothetical protein
MGGLDLLGKEAEDHPAFRTCEFINRHVIILNQVGPNRKEGDDLES